MADDTPTSPPGSWPDGNIIGESSTDEAEPVVPSECQPRQNGKGKMSETTKSTSEKVAMLPPEILEQ